MKLQFFLLLALLFGSAVLSINAEATINEDAAAEATEDASPEAEAEEEVVEASRDGLSAEERETLDAGAETHEFQAEVNRLMDIIINSLYSNREIFLRELISNAADALDKMRFVGLTDSEATGEGDDAELDIKIKFDKEKNTLSITDKGVGMTKDNLKQNLGVVAKSGTTEFLEAAASGGDTLSLIGQFGVGFYSVYLVADKVTVISKHSDDEQYIWESTANSVFSISKDPRGNTLGKHGTEIVLTLKEDAEEFCNQAELEKLVQRYSQFINFPIYLWETRTESKQVPVEEEETEEEASEADGEELDVSDEEDDEGDKEPKMETVTEEISEWKRLNDVKAIWVRSPKEIEEDEYTAFYKSLTKDSTEPLEKIHFVAEGEITFRSILFIPAKAEQGLYDNINAKQTGLKLYVRRVLISDSFDDFLPSYLNFVKGVVDSDDLPLNVSRETLAQSRVLKVMSKKLTRKVLELLRTMAAKAEEAEEEDEDDEDEEGEGKEEKEEEEKEDEGPMAYDTFWKEYGKSIKLGVIQDRKNKSKLTKLLRFETSTSAGKFISLETYIDRMQEDQSKIYYITGETIDKCKQSPSVEKLLKKGFEVLLMADPLDEYVMQSLNDFDGVDFQSASKDSLKFGNEQSASFKEVVEEFKPFTDWLKATLSDKIEKATVSNRLTNSPAVLVTGQYGWSGNMERIMKAQALGSNEAASFSAPKKTFEVNPRHPIIVALKEKVAADKKEDTEDESLKDLATLLYDTSLLSDGFVMEDAETFSNIITRVVSMGLDIDPDAPVEDEVEEEEEEEEEEAAAEEEEEEEEVEAEEASE